jgi:hypothetical protein
VGLNPAMYWVGVSHASYYTLTEKGNKGSQMGQTQKNNNVLFCLFYSVSLFPISGFWASDTCSSQVSSTVYRIFDISCNPLTDFPEKKLYLRQFHQQFLIGSKATFDCQAGHQFTDGVRNFAN